MPKEASKLLLVEDDPFILEWVERLRNEEFQDVEILEVRSESEFLSRKEQLANSGVSGIILDVMLPWEGDSQAGLADPGEPRGEYFDAGIRILKDIVQTPKLSSAAVLIHTVNDRSAVEIPPTTKPEVTFLRKDEPDEKLVRWVKRHL
jgi:CheY-like chemotaxis protein